MGENAGGRSVYIYYQMCPSCKEPIAGLKEIATGKFPWVDIEEGMILLRKDK